LQTIFKLLKLYSISNNNRKRKSTVLQSYTSWHHFLGTAPSNSSDATSTATVSTEIPKYFPLPASNRLSTSECLPQYISAPHEPFRIRKLSTHKFFWVFNTNKNFCTSHFSRRFIINLRLFENYGNRNPMVIEKIRCILNYFDRVVTKGISLPPLFISCINQGLINFLYF